MQYLECPDLSENKFVDCFVGLNKKAFRFIFKWNEYCDCCFLDIYDSSGNEVQTGIALVCNAAIKTDKRVIPFFLVKHKDLENLEPTPETMKDYRLIYEDTTAE